MRKITLEQLQGLANIVEGKTCNLKIESENERMYLARLVINQGQISDNNIIVEKQINGFWYRQGDYQAV